MPYPKLSMALLTLSLTVPTLSAYASDKAVQTTTSAKTFRVTLLGTCIPMPQIARGGNSTLVEIDKEKIVFYFGRNATSLLWQRHIPIGQVNDFFLRHFHSDHTFDLPDLWLTGWLQPAYGLHTTPMQLQGTVHLAKGLEQAYATDITTRQKDEGTLLNGVQIIDAHDDQPCVVYDKDGVKVIAFANDHGDNIEPSFGYRIEYRGHVAVLSGDTRDSAEVIKKAHGSDLLVYCVSLTSDSLMKDNPGYQAISGYLSSPAVAARVFNGSKSKLAVFSHIGLNGDVTVGDMTQQVRTLYSGLFVVGKDLIRFDINRN